MRGVGGREGMVAEERKEHGCAPGGRWVAKSSYLS